MSGFPMLRPHHLPALPPERKWLIDELWSHQAVGIIGGEPKSGKSFLALEIAIAVATGTACLSHYRVQQSGTVLLYAAEDALHIVRERLGEMCRKRGIPLAQLDIWIVTVPVMRLDHKVDQQRLVHTLQTSKPTLLILDPFVRLHQIDENASGEVAPLLAFLRQQQRETGCAVILVHHTKKGSSSLRGGQALRGSSEFHAWGDSNIYLRYTAKGLQMDIEHRAAPSQKGIPIELSANKSGAALIAGNRQQIEERLTATTEDNSPRQRVLKQLQNETKPLKTRPLRKLCKIKAATLTSVLAELETTGLVIHSKDGWAVSQNVFPANP